MKTEKKVYEVYFLPYNGKEKELKGKFIKERVDIWEFNSERPFQTFSADPSVDPDKDYHRRFPSRGDYPDKRQIVVNKKLSIGGFLLMFQKLDFSNSEEVSYFKKQWKVNESLWTLYGRKQILFNQQSIGVKKVKSGWEEYEKKHSSPITGMEGDKETLKKMLELISMKHRREEIVFPLSVLKARLARIVPSIRYSKNKLCPSYKIREDDVFAIYLIEILQIIQQNLPVSLCPICQNFFVNLGKKHCSHECKEEALKEYNKYHK